MKKMFLFAACLAVLACSCSENEEGTVKDVRASLKINANIGAPAVSRAEKTAWEAGDKLGLYVCNGTLGTPYNQNAVYTNTPFTYSAAGWTSEEILLDENEATVFAYYPYDATLTTPSALPVDITTQTDHLYGQGDTKASILNRNVNITMKHALSQVVFRMKKTEGYRQEGVLTGITLKNGKYSINSLVYWVTYVHNVVYSFYRSMIYCYINSTQRCAGSIVIDIIPTNGADKRKFFPFAPYFPVTNVIKRYFYPYFPAIIGIKGYSFPYFPYLSGIMKIKTALYSLFSRLDWHKTVVFPCLGEIYEGIRSLSWEIPVT